jgi:hypothetical protein
LSLIKHELEREIENGRTTEVLDATYAYHTDPPFRCEKLNELIEEVEKFLDASRNGLPKTLTAAAVSLETAKTKAARWTPLYYRRYEITAERKEDWRIIEQWPVWESRGMTSSERRDEHLKHFGKPLPSNWRADVRTKNTFEHRCRFLRCQATVRAKRNSLKRKRIARGVW